MLRKPLFWFVMLLLLLMGGLSYYLRDDLLAMVVPQPEAPAEEETVASAPVRRGNMLISVGGVGELVPAKEINLGFRTSGTVSQITVQVGDRVNAETILATLDDGDLQRGVLQSGIEVRSADLLLADLLADPSVADVAAAQASLADAQAAFNSLTAPPTEEAMLSAQSQLTSAQAALNTLVAGISSDEVLTLNADLRSAQVALQAAQSAYNQIGWRADAGTTTQAADLQNATIAFEKAQAQYNISAAGASTVQIAAARATVAQAQEALNALEQGPDPMDIAAAQARIEQAQAAYDELLGGPTDNAIEQAELTLQQARQNLDAVLMDLNGATIKSPVSGVITAVAAGEGQQVGTETIITIVDTESAQVRFWIDELDILNARIGNKVVMLFEAFPDIEFDGEVARIEPALVDVEGAPAVQAWATIDIDQHDNDLLFGMNAEVEIIAGEATNALLVPIQSLRELVPGSYAVFIVDERGELEMRPVEVGLQDFVNAEIISGVFEGELVSTGDIQTQ